jgi:hypothetical protein
MDVFGKYISVLLLSSIKLVLGSLPLSVYYEFDTTTMILLNLFGGTIGIIVFVGLSEKLNSILNKFMRKKNSRKFTVTNRIIIKVKWYGGLYGISLITPLFLSIPLGSFLCVRYFKNKTKIMLSLFLSLTFWVTLFSLLGGK